MHPWHYIVGLFTVFAVIIGAYEFGQRSRAVNQETATQGTTSEELGCRYFLSGVMRHVGVPGPGSPRSLNPQCRRVVRLSD